MTVLPTQIQNEDITQAANYPVLTISTISERDAGLLCSNYNSTNRMSTYKVRPVVGSCLYILLSALLIKLVT